MLRFFRPELATRYIINHSRNVTAVGQPLWQRISTHNVLLALDLISPRVPCNVLHHCIFPTARPLALCSVFLYKNA